MLNRGTGYPPQTSLTGTLNLLALAGICVSLLMAYYFQLVLNEIPCPLCMLQRIALLMVGAGFALNVRFGPSAAHYAITLLSAVVGAGISTRQILLHIAPGDPGFGSPFLGLHLYTWGLIAFVATIVFTALMLLLDRNRLSYSVYPSGRKSVLAFIVLLVFLGLALTNLVSATMVCDFGVCPDNPTEYKVPWR